MRTTPIFLGTIFLLIATSIAYADESDVTAEKTMAIVAEGGGSFPLMGGGSFGAGGRFEYAFSRFFSLIIPLEYRFISFGGFAESSTFDVVTAGIGGRLYFSQLFWPQKNLRGFFGELHTGFGPAVEESGDPGVEARVKNKGFSFALSGALGYSYAFDFGLVLGGMVNISGRAFMRPIKQRGMIAHPNPELLLQLGWAF